MQIIETPLGEIRPYKRNAKKHDAKQVANVAESIRQYGFVQPIVVDGDGVIVIGHCRYAAAKELGMTTVPCVCVDELKPAQVDALRIVDNKTNESPWDFDLLSADLPSLDLSAFDFDFGIPSMEESADEEAAEPEDQTENIPQAVEDEPPEVDETSEPICRRGELWQLGRHRLMCGDSLAKSDMQRLMGEEKADLLITDPPYGIDYVGKTPDALKIANDSFQGGEFMEFLRDAFVCAAGSMRDGAAWYIWLASTKADIFMAACVAAGWTVRQVLVWVKNSLVLGRQDYQWRHELCLYGWLDGAAHYWGNDRSQTTVLEFDKPNRNDIHPTMKPVRMFDYQIRNSCRPGDIVIDIFGGSGTTLIACEQNERICRTMEIDPRYCDAIIKRWENLTGQKAVRVNDDRRG